MSKKSYHHGNLREVLLNDAIATVETLGPQSLSLRQLVKDAGVSSTAYSSHFKNKRELLAAIATVGFQRLYVTLGDRALEGDDPEQQLQQEMETWVGFAIENPGLYSLMFGQEISGFSDSQELWAAMSGTYNTLEKAVRNNMPPQSGDDAVQMATYACWSKAHGLALLLLNEKIVSEDSSTEGQRALVKSILSFQV